MAEAVERLLNRKRSQIKQAAASAPPTGPARAGPDVCPDGPESTTCLEINRKHCNTEPSGAALDRNNRRNARFERYSRVVEMTKAGLSKREVARQCGLSRVTVRRYLSAEGFPEISARRAKPTMLDPFREFVERRLADEPLTAARLFRDLKTRGYPGSYSALLRYLESHGCKTKAASPAARVLPKKRSTSPRSLSVALLREPDKREEGDSSLIEGLRALCPEIDHAIRLAGEFAGMVRSRSAARFDHWREQVDTAAVPELSRFAEVLDRDRPAVLAGMTLQWSNGATEGHVNRLKTIKRLMYGRAGFQMLRKRVLVPP
jgi:transposase